MSTSAIVNVDDFGVSIPEPNEAFTSTIIHPKNLAIQARQESARKLTRQELTETNQELTKLRKLLDASGYYDQLAEYKLLKSRYKFYAQQAEVLPEGEERSENLQLMRQCQEKGAALKSSLLSLQKPAARHAYLAELLNDHRLAVEREIAHWRLNKQMAKEASKWKEILIETLARLGFCHETYDKKGRKVVNKVQFSEVVITPDAVWYKIFVTVKTMFGFKSVLPYRVKIGDMIEERTLEELSHACQRQVTAVSNFANGVWLKVNRIGTTDGLLNYVTLEQVLNNYPHEERRSMPIPIGVGEGRNISWIMLKEHPHFLVAGSTGNGKSNLTRVFICSLIRFQSPQELRLCFVDLKDGAEFAAFEGIPHLLMPVIKNVEEAVNVLAQMDALRADRMKQIARARCRDITEYNARFPNNPLPEIAIFIDEYARVKSRGKEFEAIADRAVGEITALGRAAGVHLFAATQTPYARILPGEAKNNMALRIALAVATPEASKSIVGNGDAYRLDPENKGRAIAAVGSVRWQIQVPHGTPADVDLSVKMAMEWAQPEDDIALPEVAAIESFNENELFDIVINELRGELMSDKIWNHVKGAGTVTQSEVREMVKKLRLHPHDICFEGKWYAMKKVRGGGYRLVEIRETSSLREIVETEHSDGESHRVDHEVGISASDVTSGESTHEVPSDEEITALALEKVT